MSPLPSIRSFQAALHSILLFFSLAIFINNHAFTHRDAQRVGLTELTDQSEEQGGGENENGAELNAVPIVQLSHARLDFSTVRSVFPPGKNTKCSRPFLSLPDPPPEVL